MSLLWACNNGDGTGVEYSVVGEFPKAIALEGENVVFDTIPGVVGEVYVSDGEYLFYLYASDHFIMVTDSTFHIKGYLGRQGQGPHDILGVSGPFGQRTPDGGVMMYDSYAIKLYEGNHNVSDEVHVVADLSTNMIGYAPRAIIRLSDGKFVGVRGNFKYGLVAYANGDGQVVEWPIGDWLADDKQIIPVVVSHRALHYNPVRKIVGEIYGSIPLVILHDESGLVVKMLLFEENMPSLSALDDDAPDYFRSIKLTNNYIYLLQGDDAENEYSRLMVLDYDGVPQADLHIAKASTFDVDTVARKVIAVNPNSDDDGENVRVYELPVSISHP